MRFLTLTFMVLIVAIQTPLWFGKGGWLRVWELQRSIAVQQDQNGTLATRNAVLAAEVRSLKEGREAIEERARQELHMTRGDEILFQLVRPEEQRNRLGPASMAKPAP